MRRVALQECPGDFLRAKDAALVHMVYHRQKFARQGRQAFGLCAGDHGGIAVAQCGLQVGLRGPAGREGRIVSRGNLIGPERAGHVTQLALEVAFFLERPAKVRRGCFKVSEPLGGIRVPAFIPRTDSGDIEGVLVRRLI